MFKFVAVLALVAGALAQTPVNSCDSVTPVPDNVNFNDCTESPCQIPHGGTVTLDLTFTAPRDLSTVIIEVFADALGIQIPIPIGDNDVCNGLVDGSCPIAAGTTVTFHNEVPILDILPQMSVGLTFAILEDLESDGIVCAHIDAEIV